MDELSRSNNDMKNLLNSTDIATLFLDKDLNVRRFTTAGDENHQAHPGDVGRPITDLASDLLYPELADDAREVLRKLALRGKSRSTRAMAAGSPCASCLTARWTTALTAW